MVDAINTKKFDFIVVNYANGDMVGHTGIYKAIEKAVVTIDACLHDTVAVSYTHLIVEPMSLVLSWNRVI